MQHKPGESLQQFDNRLEGCPGLPHLSPLKSQILRKVDSIRPDWVRLAHEASKQLLVLKAQWDFSHASETRRRGLPTEFSFDERKVGHRPAPLLPPST